MGIILGDARGLKQAENFQGKEYSITSVALLSEGFVKPTPYRQSSAAHIWLKGGSYKKT